MNYTELEKNGVTDKTEKQTKNLIEELNERNYNALNDRICEVYHKSGEKGYLAYLHEIMTPQEFSRIQSYMTDDEMNVEEILAAHPGCIVVKFGLPLLGIAGFVTDSQAILPVIRDMFEVMQPDKTDDATADEVKQIVMSRFPVGESNEGNHDDSNGMICEVYHKTGGKPYMALLHEIMTPQEFSRIQSYITDDAMNVEEILAARPGCIVVKFGLPLLGIAGFVTDSQAILPVIRDMFEVMQPDKTDDATADEVKQIVMSRFPVGESNEGNHDNSDGMICHVYHKSGEKGYLAYLHEIMTPQEFSRIQSYMTDDEMNVEKILAAHPGCIVVKFERPLLGIAGFVTDSQAILPVIRDMFEVMQPDKTDDATADEVKQIVMSRFPVGESNEGNHDNSDGMICHVYHKSGEKGYLAYLHEIMTPQEFSRIQSYITDDAMNVEKILAARPGCIVVKFGRPLLGIAGFVTDSQAILPVIRDMFEVMQPDKTDDATADEVKQIVMSRFPVGESNEGNHDNSDGMICHVYHKSGEKGYLAYLHEIMTPQEFSRIQSYMTDDEMNVEEILAAHPGCIVVKFGRPLLGIAGFVAVKTAKNSVSQILS